MTRTVRVACALAVASLLAASGADGAPRLEHQTLRIAGGIVEIFLDPRLGAVVRGGRDGFIRVRAWPLSAWPVAASKVRRPEPARRAAMLPDGAVSEGRRNIRAAWLTGPTGRYAHGALGDGVEASGLAAEDAFGRVAELRLSEAAVFEDRFARIVDVDGDDRDEILVVKSYLNRGAALAAFELTRAGLRPLAESEPVGAANRWLNPVGAADFDGDGRVEVAAVRTPHIGGVLTLYRLDDGVLTEVARYPGFSNHRMGSRRLGLSAIADFDGDGIADIAAPSADRQALRIVSLAGGRLAELARFESARGPIVTDILAIDLTREGRPDLVYGTAEGFLGAVFHR